MEKISTNYYCARRSYYHTMTPDQTSTVPAINYPAHHDHNLGSKFKENFCSRFRGWIEIPADGRYNFKAECSDGCRLYLGFRDTKNLYAASNRVLYYDGRQVARDRKVRPWCAAVVCRRVPGRLRTRVDVVWYGVARSCQSGLLPLVHARRALEGAVYEVHAHATKAVPRVAIIDRNAWCARAAFAWCLCLCVRVFRFVLFCSGCRT